jgi:hypothetical protein
MPPYDSYGNSIETTLFESYLSKVIIEQRKLYEPLYIKINQSIQRMVDANQQNKEFSRQLHSCLTLVNIEYPGHSQLESFLQPGFHLHAANYFHKLFFEKIIRLAAIPAHNSATKSLTLAERAQRTVCSSEATIKKLSARVYPPMFFNPEHRGRIEQELETEPVTRKLGIAQEEYTPNDLKYYYPTPYCPAQMQFLRDYNGSVSKKMQLNHLPYISGPSGTAGTCFQSMIQLDTYTAEELKLYFMVLSASMVARGHHSFYEVMMIAETIGFKIKDYSERQQYYEQFLTVELKNSIEYKTFIQSQQAQTYFNQVKHTVIFSN